MNHCLEKQWIVMLGSGLLQDSEQLLGGGVIRLELLAIQVCVLEIFWMLCCILNFWVTKISPGAFWYCLLVEPKSLKNPNNHFLGGFCLELLAAGEHFLICVVESRQLDLPRWGMKVVGNLCAPVQLWLLDSILAQEPKAWGTTIDKCWCGSHPKAPLKKAYSLAQK